MITGTSTASMNCSMMKMGVFEVVDEKEEMEHEIKKSVKDGARGTEERVSMTSENIVYNTYVKPMSISTRPSMQRC